MLLWPCLPLLPLLPLQPPRTALSSPRSHAGPFAAGPFQLLFLLCPPPFPGVFFNIFHHPGFFSFMSLPATLQASDKEAVNICRGRHEPRSAPRCLPSQELPPACNLDGLNRIPSCSTSHQKPVGGVISGCRHHAALCCFVFPVSGLLLPCELHAHVSW